MTTAEEEQTIRSLFLLSRSCTIALAHISKPESEPEPDSPPLHLILADLDALLAFIYNLSTKLTLALKPPAPSYSASVPLLHDLVQHTSALAHSTRRLHGKLHGAALVKDVTHRVKDVVDALRVVTQTFLNNAPHGPQLPESGASGEEYLVRTGALHDLITNARCPSGIPKDNRAAVCLSWKSDSESLDDNLQEITRVISEAESGSDHPHDDSDVDDGWDEFGLGHATELDKRELARAKNVQQILRLTTLLHKRIFLDLLAYPSSAPVSTYDALLEQSNLLLSTSDDLVAALYTPQDPDNVYKEILQLVDIITSLRTQIFVLLPLTDDLENQLHALDLDDRGLSSPPPKKRANKRWFDTCVDQIVRLCSGVSESPKQTNSPNVAQRNTALHPGTG